MDRVEEAVKWGGWTHDPSKEPPAVPEQCKLKGWPFGYFWTTEANKIPKLCQFNPGLCLHRGRLLYCSRQSNYFFGRPLTWDSRVNNVLLGEIDQGTMNLGPLRELKFHKEHYLEQVEDARIVSTSMGVFLSGTISLPYEGFEKDGMPQQVLMTLDDEFNVTRFWRPVLGGNSPDIKKRRHEKNWLWFETATGEMAVVYHHTPQTVVHYDPETDQSRIFRSNRIPPWSHGDLRGGTNPVCWRGQWLTVAHVCEVHPDAPIYQDHWRLKRYCAVAVRFEPEPPYRITAYTDPLLSGSTLSDSPPVTQPAVFPSGLAVEGDLATLAFGVNDQASCWAKIPLEELAWHQLSL